MTNIIFYIKSNMDNFNIYQESNDMSDHEFVIHKQALQQDVKDYSITIK